MLAGLKWGIGCLALAAMTMPYMISALEIEIYQPDELSDGVIYLNYRGITENGFPCVEFPPEIYQYPIDLKRQANGDLTFSIQDPSEQFISEKHIIADGVTFEPYMELTVSEPYLLDFHDFRITEDGRAIMDGYQPKAPDGSLTWNIIEEVDLASGETLFLWDSEDYFDPAESDQSFDFVHINSIDVGPDGHLLISARNYSQLVKICWNEAAGECQKGEVLWRLGGPGSDFLVPAALEFHHQHDARWTDEGTITLFDNHDNDADVSSRGLELALDMDQMTVRLVWSYSVEGLNTAVGGSVQKLENGNKLVSFLYEVHEINARNELVMRVSSQDELLYRAQRDTTVDCSEPIPGTLPDLTVVWQQSLIECAASTPTPEQPRCILEGTFTVVNLGEIASGSSSVDVYFSPDGVQLDSRAKLETLFLDVVAPNQNRQFQFSVPIRLGTLAAGGYVVAVVDPVDQQPESDETNNTIGSPLIYSAPDVAPVVERSRQQATHGDSRPSSRPFSEN